MSDLKGIDKLKFEKLFDMGSGYVLDFSNRTFQEFILEHLGIDIYDEKYDYASGSKANRLRAFWQKESNYLVAKLNSEMLEYWRTIVMLNDYERTKQDEELYEECKRINKKLKKDSYGEHIEVIQPLSETKDFSLLAKSIRESIKNNEPETALDRLHTYLVKYIRELCDRYNIEYDKNKPLHSIFGEYINHLEDEDRIESEMTIRILKSSISIFDSFNKVRNDQSFAHDNEILNYEESMLIFKSISAIIEFITSIETEEEVESEEDHGEDDWYDDLPF